MERNWRKVAWSAAAAVLALAVWGATAPPTPNGAYTRDQAAQGRLVFIQFCVRCHGAQLEGGAGPPLQGPVFGQSLETGKMTGHDLYAFIRAGMPMNAPGSLTDTQYADVLAYILQRNGYAPGSTPLSAASASQIALLPYPGLAPNPAPSPSPTASGAPAVPASAKVVLDDATLLSAAQDANDWRLPGRTYDNARYSPLKQIDPSNVARLVPVKIVHTGMFASFETTPIVVDGIMYITTPVVNHEMKVMALHADTGAIIWTRMLHLNAFKICCGPNNRGIAIGYGSLFLTTLDDRLVALDARSGAEHWEKQVADPAVGYSESMAPQVYDGEVIVGSAGGEWALRGFVAAFDARTGTQRWRWFATDPKTFAGNSWKTGGGTVWTTPAIDPARHLVIFGTGNPNPDMNGSTRAGDNLYTDSIVALDARSGKLRWYYQEVKHDLWDYDATSNVVLFDVRRNGETIPAAGQAGKVGWFFIVDRRNGRLLTRSQAFVEQNPHMFQQKAVLPGANGGSEWSPPAYNPDLHAVFVLGINQLMDFTTSTIGKNPGFIRTGSVFTNVKKPKVQTGTVTAIDVDTGKIRWQYRSTSPMAGGVLATAGGLVFTGEGDGTFEAFDARSGARLWTYQFAGGANAPPVSYEVNGTQFVAVAAGGSFQFDFKRGDALGIFRLRR